MASPTEETPTAPRLITVKVAISSGQGDEDEIVLDMDHLLDSKNSESVAAVDDGQNLDKDASPAGSTPSPSTALSQVQEQHQTEKQHDTHPILAGFGSYLDAIVTLACETFDAVIVHQVNRAMDHPPSA
jgi:hypothetical protein